MADREHAETQKDVEKYLADKAKSSIGKTVEGILNDDSVKKIVEKTVVRQSIETGFFLSFLIIGMMTLANAAKQAVGLTWQGDLIIGLTLITVGGVYMIRKLFHK